LFLWFSCFFFKKKLLVRVNTNRKERGESVSLSLPVSEVTRMFAAKGLAVGDATSLAEAMAISGRVTFERFFQFVKNHKIQYPIEWNPAQQQRIPTLRAIQTISNVLKGSPIENPTHVLDASALVPVFAQL
jgi:hypothetical protein